MEIEVVVEVPQGSRHRYETDHATGVIRLQRDIHGVRCPTEYGFVHGTLGADGAPLDAMVVLEEPAFPGCRVACRPIGLCCASEHDARVLAVPTWDERRDLWELSPDLLTGLRRFLEGAGELLPDGPAWGPRAAAEAEVVRSQERFATRTRARTRLGLDR